MLLQLIMVAFISLEVQGRTFLNSLPIEIGNNSNTHTETTNLTQVAADLPTKSSELTYYEKTVVTLFVCST